jgi:hypothetical protein
MTTDYTSLLSLDSFADEESVRVAVYDRAMKVEGGTHEVIERNADLFLAFVKDARWRLDVLDVALRRSSARCSAAFVLEKAEAIAAWVETQTEPEVAPVAAPAPKKKSSKKTGGKKKF